MKCGAIHDLSLVLHFVTGNMFGSLKVSCLSSAGELILPNETRTVDHGFQKQAEQFQTEQVCSDRPVS